MGGLLCALAAAFRKKVRGLLTGLLKVHSGGTAQAALQYGTAPLPRRL